MAKAPPRRVVIAFRVDDLEHARLDALRSTFEETTWREMFEWLFAQEDVMRVIRKRIVEGPEETPLLQPPRHDRLLDAPGS